MDNLTPISDKGINRFAHECTSDDMKLMNIHVFNTEKNYLKSRHKKNSDSTFSSLVRISSKTTLDLKVVSGTDEAVGANSIFTDSAVLRKEAMDAVISTHKSDKAFHTLIFAANETL